MILSSRYVQKKILHKINMKLSLIQYKEVTFLDHHLTYLIKIWNLEYFLHKIDQKIKDKDEYIQIPISMSFVSQKRPRKKNQFKYNSIQESRKKLPQVINTRQIYQLSNSGIIDNLLTYFQTLQWKQDVRLLNLTNNYITSADVIFDNLVNLKNLYLKKNLIKKISIKKTMKRLECLNLSDNVLEKIEGLQLLVSLNKLDLSSNELRGIEQLNMQDLEILCINKLKLTSIKQLENSKLPKLKKLSMISTFENQNQQNEKMNQNQSILLEFPSLQQIQIEDKIPSRKLSILSTKLRVLILTNMEMDSVRVSVINIQKIFFRSFSCKVMEKYAKEEVFQNLIQVQINSTKIGKCLEFFIINSQNIQSIVFNRSNLLNQPIQEQKKIDERVRFFDCFNNEQMRFLQKIQFYQCPISLNNLKKFKLSTIKRLSITNCSVNCIEQLSTLNLNFLVHVNLQANNIKKIFPLELNNAKIVDLGLNQIESIQPLSKWTAPNLMRINLHINKIKKIFRMNFPNLTFLNFLGNPLEDTQEIQNSVFSEKIFLAFSSCKITSFPDISIKNKMKQRFQENSLKVCELNVKKNCLTIFPNLSQCTELVQINAQQNKITSIDSFLQAIPEQLKIVNFSKNSIKSLKTITTKSKLQKISINNNLITDISQFCYSVPNMVQKIEFKTNQIQIFPIINAQSLISLDLSQNMIQKINLSTSNLPNLRQLFLNSNKISQIQGLIGDFEVLMLQNNQIEDVVFLQDPKLKAQEISLNKNKIKKFNKIPSNCVFIQASENKIQQLGNFLESDCNKQSLGGIFTIKGNLKRIQQMRTQISSKFINLSVDRKIQAAQKEIYLPVPKADFCTECNKKLGNFYYWCYWSKKQTNKSDFKCRQCIETLKQNNSYKYLENTILVSKDTKEIYESLIGNNIQPENGQQPVPHYICSICRKDKFQKGIARYMVLEYDKDGKQQQYGFEDLCQTCMIKYINDQEDIRTKIYSPSQAFLRIQYSPKSYYLF